jgi:UDP-glucose 4-epimerase
VNDDKNGMSEIIIDENADCQPQTLYAESKLEAERVAIKICEAKEIALTILRLAPVIGEENVGNAARLVSAIDNGRFVWIGNGENLKTLIYKRDVATACLKILINKKGETEIFNLAAEPITMKEFVVEIAKHLGKEVPKFSIPTSVLNIVFHLNAKLFGLKKVYEISDTVEKWLSNDIYSAKKIEEVYGFQPKFSIAEATERQVNWYKSDKRQKLRQK